MKCKLFVLITVISLAGCVPASSRTPFLSGGQKKTKVPQSIAFLFDIGRVQEGRRVLWTPQAVDIDPLGNLLVLDEANLRVERFDSRGNPNGELIGTRALSAPKDVFSSGELGAYVLESGVGIIGRYDLRGNFSGEISMRVPESGFSSVFDRIAVDRSGRIYLTDRTGERVVVFSGTGGFLRAIHPETLSREFRPSGIAVGKDGTVFVSDPVSSEIAVIDELGATVRIWRTGEAPSRPSGLTVDRYGNLFVADCGADRVLVYSKEGRLLFSAGTSGEGPGSFRCPVDVAVSGDDILFVADRGNSRVQALRIEYDFPES